LTNTAISSARLYWDTTQISTGWGFFDVRGVTIPVAVSVFPDEICAAPRSWAERAYPKLIYYKARQGRSFRCLGTAGAVFLRDASSIPVAAPTDVK
jgi:hypothetical protein